MSLMYCSCVGEEGFRGAFIVKAKDLRRAVKVANRLGINPGGEIMGVDVPDDIAAHPATKKYMNRLLTREEIAKHDFEMGSDKGPKRLGDLPCGVKEAVIDDAEFLCQHHNNQSKAPSSSG
jgi:ABC-type proline/glycine betaine transport system ATPase subunit